MTEKNLVKNTGNLAGTKNSACDNTGNLIVKLIELTICVVSSAVAFKACNTIDSIMSNGYNAEFCAGSQRFALTNTRDNPESPHQSPR